MPVLQRKELESSPLADLHAIASELGLEGFRAKRRDDLIGAILAAQGGEEEPAAAVEDDREPDEVPSDETLEAPVAEAPAEAAVEEALPAGEAEPEVVEAEPEVADAEPEVVDAEPEVVDAEPEVVDAEPEVVEEEPEVVEEEVSDEEIVTGVLDILTNGSGFVRMDPAGQSRDDVYVSPAQIRRCELRAGDEVSGPVRPPRRNERHPSLIRVETVNGAPAEPPEERPWFGELTPVFPRERLTGPPALDAVPFGKGSRMAVSGAPGTGASTLLLEVARTLAERHPELSVQVVLAGVRPEEVGEWAATGLPVAGGSFERSPEAQAQAAELAVERAKRHVERGGHAAVIVDALDALPPSLQRRLFGAARATEEGGTLTIVAATGEERDALRWAGTRVVLESGGRVSGTESGTLRADLLS
jgi:transcription termination factor Rho